MKKILYIACVAVLGIAVLQACMKDSRVTYEGPALAFFLSPTDGLLSLQEDQVFNIPLGTTVASNQDRTISLSITSSTAERGVQYDYTSADVVIPAGELIASLPITGLYAGFVDNVDTLIVTIIGGDIERAAFSQQYELIIRRFCPVVIEDLYGIYTATGSSFGGQGWTMHVMPNPNGGDTLLIQNPANVVAYGGFLPGSLQLVKIALDYSDPDDFTVTFPGVQQLFVEDGYGPQFIKQGVTKGTFSSCDRTITIRFEIFDDFWNWGSLGNTLTWTAPLP